jgi:hypothetical protein
MADLTIVVFIVGRALAVADEGEVTSQLEAEMAKQRDVAELAQAAMPSSRLQRDDIVPEVGLEGLALILEDVDGEVAEDDGLVMRLKRFLEVEVECRAFFAPARQ